MKKVDRSFSILCRALFLNFFNIFIHYPKMVYMCHHPDKYSMEEQYDYSIKIFKVILKTCHIKLEAYGLENIPTEDGFYLCANHQEKFDPLAIWCTIPNRVGVILNDAACHRPFIKEIVTLIKSQKLINTDIHSVLKSFAAVTRELKQGFNYLVFPEGDYEQEYNTLAEFHAGSFKSPQKAKCPIIPVALKDSYRIFDKGFRTTKPIQIHYLKPVMPEEYKDLSTKELAEMVRSRIQKEISK